MTPAERPHPFPSRTRKLSSPAPKILRGQPFGKIGRRRGFCVSGGHHPPISAAGCADPRLSFLDHDRRFACPGSARRCRRRSADGARRRSGVRARRTPRRPAAAGAIDPVKTICPYLLSADGAWRSSSAAREHRCTAVTPAAPLAAEKQRRLCLTVSHGACATYIAATEARSAVHRETTTRRPITRTTPVVLDHGRLAVALPAMSRSPSVGQAALVALLAVAFVAVLIARLASGGGAAPGAGVGPRDPPRPHPVPAPRPSPAMPRPRSRPRTRRRRRRRPWHPARRWSRPGRARVRRAAITRRATP